MENILKNKSYYSEVIYPNWVKTNGGRELYFNLKNTKKDMDIGDCVIRAIALATNEDYDKVYFSFGNGIFPK